MEVAEGRRVWALDQTMLRRGPLIVPDGLVEWATMAAGRGHLAAGRDAVPELLSRRARPRPSPMTLLLMSDEARQELAYTYQDSAGPLIGLRRRAWLDLATPAELRGMEWR